MLIVRIMDVVVMESNQYALFRCSIASVLIAFEAMRILEMLNLFMGFLVDSRGSLVLWECVKKGIFSISSSTILHQVSIYRICLCIIL